jgi:hypothetical protein
MRRNSENLLVLAGHDATRRWNQPVSLVDVLRAAVSEIEQYERVTLNVQPGIAVRGHAVNDVVHLLAELAENATSFSSAETPVVVAGHLLSSGGVLLDITDQGVGMGAEEMAHANWRLDNPPVVDVAVSRRMGLFVVARLAARHGIRVRLRPAAAGGLTALVWLPDEVVSHEASGGAPGMRGFELPPAGLAAVGAGGAPSPSGTLGGLNLGGNGNGHGNGNGDGLGSPAEQEINAARAPKFAGQQLAPPAASQSDQQAESALGPRRVPGAGPRPGNPGWGGAATTSPLPAIGSEAAEAGLAAASAESGSYDQDDAYGMSSRPAEASGPTADFSSTPGTTSVQPVVLGQPSVVGQAATANQSASAAQPGAVRPSPAGGNGDGLSVREAGGGRRDFGWDSAPGSRQRSGVPASASGSYGPDDPLGSTGPRTSAGPLTSGGGVVLPAAEHVATENRLPIFEAVESDWFRRGRSGVAAPGAAPASSGGQPPVMTSPATGSGQGGGSAASGGFADGPAGPGNGHGGQAGLGGAPDGWPSEPPPPAPEPEVTWAASAADQGWEAAAAASSPATGGTTTAGLPKRVPQANLVPGTASPDPVAPAPARSASATRDRFASFQRGAREGRAAVSGDDGHSDGDDGSR